MGTATLLASGVALAKTVEWCKRDANKCEGTRNDDVLRGTNTPDRIFGLKGDDTLYGFGKSDKLYGGRGDDWLFGYRESDKLYGGRGADALIGGYDDRADDTLKGGRGADEYYFGGNWGEDVITDSAVVDTDDDLAGNYDANVMLFEITGDLTINLNSDSGPVPEATEGVNTVNWSCPKDQDPECDPNVIDGVKIESLGNDKVTGNSSANTLGSEEEGPNSDNTGGSDTLSGEGGDDEIGRRDVSGNDTLSGGEGDDWIENEDKSGNDTISGGEGNDDIDNVDKRGNDIVSGGEGNDFIRSDIPDSLTSGSASGGNDTVSGEEGNDTIDVKDSFGGDTVDCGEDVGDGDTDTVRFDEGDIISPNCENQNPPPPPGCDLGVECKGLPITAAQAKAPTVGDLWSRFLALLW